MTVPFPSDSGPDTAKVRPPAPPPAIPLVPPPVPGASPPTPPAVPAALAAPPVPPLHPAPPPVPPMTATWAVGESAERVVTGGRGGGRPRRRSGGGLGLAITLLAVAATAVTGYVAWPHLERSLVAAGKPARSRTRIVEVAARPAPEPAESPAPVADVREPIAAVPESDLAPRSRRDSAPAADSEPMLRAEPVPEPEPSPPEPRSEPNVPTVPAPEPPAIDVEQVRAAVGAGIAKGYEALRRRDFVAAKRAFDGVADQALDDQRATDRLQPWRQLTLYAEQFPQYRDQALAAAASTAATYDLGSRQIAVVEFTPREFIYRDSRRPGRNLRVPLDAIPPDVEMALVEQWFAKDGRAANNLFLGAAAVSCREPNLAAARRAWQAAAAGGEPHGTLLLQILDDPAVRGR